MRLFTYGMVCTGVLTLGACAENSTLVAQVPQSVAEAKTLSEPDNRPNILLIVTDDMGYTDLGIYGGEIPTPNLDGLARDGLLLTDFYNQAVCAPTRAALLSGTDNNNAGGTMHSMPNQQGVPGYESELRREIVSLPTLLQDAGYNTYMVGKWHLGMAPDLRPGARGFDRSFALMQGGASHWADQRGLFSGYRKANYARDDKFVDTLPEDFYSTTYYTDSIIDFIEQDADSGKPWFSYVAYTAPHWPLQAPDDLIAKYAGKYDMGYEAVRAQRIERGIELGIFDENVEPYKRLDSVPPWESLSAEEKRISSKNMEVYAAMMDGLDQNVGRLIDHLKASGEYENTYIMFITDNGAEGQDRDPGDNGTDWTFDNSYENMGRKNSHIYYGESWAQVGVGPFRYFKSVASEGGIRGEAIIHFPSKGVSGQFSDAISTVVDIAPTALDIANYDVPSHVNGREVQEIQGRSMLPLATGESARVHPEGTAFGWEVFGNYAVRKDNWKLLRITSRATDTGIRGKLEGTDYWGLYDLSTDAGETTDLSAQHPDIVTDLMAEWEAWIAKNGVVLPIVP